MSRPQNAAVTEVDGASAEVVLRDKVRSMFSYTRTSLTGNLIGAVILQLMFASTAPLALRVGWGVPFAALWIARALLAWRFARDEPDSAAGYRRWLRWWHAGTLISGAWWGGAAWLFWGHGDAVQQITLVLIIYSYCVASVPILAAQAGLFSGYIALLFLPAVVRVGIGGETLGLELAGVMLLAFAMTIALGRNYRIAFDAVVELKLRTERLMEQLRAEKAVSDAARQEAEVANRAKTQFFAAASHDLRQPLHAMSLFAEALRQRTHEQPEVANLVNSINASVDALEGLFSELLDITRIYAVCFELRPQAFEVDDILRKLRLHFEPTAFEKGLALNLRGGHRVVHADPLLVERILRNLVSNAIRYTNDGGVLVAARSRGDRVILQVWDSGLGIREEEQAKVFEEFYQVPNTPAVAAHQRKGLGLGLAIVKRLADLMDAPITLRSQAGRGTVFTLELPVGIKPAPQAAVPSSKGPLGLTLAGRLVVVVEDEPAVRSGLEVLLQGWGAQVVSFESVAESSAWAAACDPATVRPDLLIVDYRLEHGRNGVDAIVELRERFGAALPAIVVTGSTMSSLDKEAQERNFHLLLKPVVPNKLRAMIAFKLNVKAA